MDELHEGTETLPQLIRRVQDARPELTQTEIARRAGVSVAAVNTWVNGARMPSRKSCDKLADALSEPRERVFAAANRRVPGPLAPDAEERILALYRRLTADEQRIVERQLAALAADDHQM
ncbi:helix-turn-helix domain-containing protein [Kitasatospora sp. RB6PN24]|uniref:helix-turn-helix transcriptional regulator n=1 Tax=Kitasatospora TaxID=2063 RepID=UPI001C684DF5|nr:MULTISPECIES: transcriptional regulator [Kitasatospora]MCC9307747.1 helix-turn-helix domain-containing protein [Kitasatospora humi]